MGTPSSGTVTNLTGTASININGTVGATTATTGAFTTISASGVITSTVVTGTAPFTVASTTQVANLNAATAGSATTFTSTTQNSQFNSVGVGTAGSTTAGEIRATNNVTAFYSSDKKLKENIQDIPDALSKVCAIGGKLFDWTDEYLAQHGGADGYFVQKSDFGVIAQDVEEQFPIAVRKREDGTLAVDYEKMCALAFAAIAELRAEVEALKKRG